MKRVELAGLIRDRELWLQRLQSAEVLEIEQLGEESEGLGGEASTRQEIEKRAADLDHQMADIDRALQFIDRYHRVRPTVIQQFTGIRNNMTRAEYEIRLASLSEVPGWVTRTDELNGVLNDVAQQRASYEAEMGALGPWRPLDITESELAGTATVKIMAGSVENGRLDLLRDGLLSSEAGASYELVSLDSRLSYIVLFLPRNDADQFSAVLGAAGFSAITLPPYGESVSGRLEWIKERLESLKKEETELLAQVAGLAEKRLSLQSVYDHLLGEKAKLLVTNGIATGEYSFYATGWVRARDVDNLEKVAAGTDCPHLLLIREPADDENPPSSLENGPVASPFEALLQMFSYPKYGEIDPTILMAPFFVIGFGFALGDAGYGLILALFNLALLKFLPMKPGGRKLAWLFIISSASTFVVGLGTGGFFGDIFRLPPLFGIDPIKQPQDLLNLALAFGAIQMFFGLFVSMFNHARNENWIAALAGEGAFALFLAAAMLMVVPMLLGITLVANKQVVLALLAAGAGLVIIGDAYGRKGWRIILALPMGFLKMYNSVGFFSDVLSYSRLMALSLSGAMVGNIVNVFVRGAFAKPMFGLGYVFAAAIFLFGHALNLALNVLGAYVHSSRLQYLEFFGKFYEGGGRPFSPFRKEYKYTQFVNKREA